MWSRIFVAAVLLLLGIAPVTAADISIAVGADVTSIDPHYHNLTPNNNIAEHIFETLVAKDPKSSLKPALAVSWKAVDDLTWEFKLRKGVKFHDGSDFTAADVVFSLERTALVPNSPSPFTLYTNQITEKIIVDPLTLRLKTATPYPLMPNDMGTVFIVSSKAARVRLPRISIPARPRSAPGRSNSCATQRATASSLRAMTTTGAPGRRGRRSRSV